MLPVNSVARVHLWAKLKGKSEGLIFPFSHKISLIFENELSVSAVLESKQKLRRPQLLQTLSTAAVYMSRFLWALTLAKFSTTEFIVLEMLIKACEAEFRRIVTTFLKL